MREDKLEISSRTVSRLTAYLTILNDLLLTRSRINSDELSKIMKTTSAQVRKDLSTFGAFGKRGIGYDVKSLIISIEEILKINTTTELILIGYGNMGHLITSNRNMLGKGFELKAVFDSSLEKVGKAVFNTDYVVKSVDSLEDYIKRHKIKTAILSVTSDAAQEVADRLCEYGITGILNLTARRLVLPEEVSIVNVDFSSKLRELNFWQNHPHNPKAGTY